MAEGNTIGIFLARIPEHMIVPPRAPAMFASWERKRYLRLRRDVDRRRFLVGRLLVRHGLSVMSDQGLTPDQWRFCRNAHGRPMLEPDFFPDSLDFNISTSGTLVVVAVSTAESVGLDLEELDNKEQLHIPVALSAREQAFLDRLPARSQYETSLRIWTVKEAVAKLVGLGLSLDLTSFSVLPEANILRVRFGPDFPFSLGKPRISQARISCAGSSYLLSLATATEVRTGKNRKNGITVLPIRIPVRAGSIRCSLAKMGGEWHVDTVSAIQSGIWGFPGRHESGEHCLAAIRRKGVIVSHAPASPL